MLTLPSLCSPQSRWRWPDHCGGTSQCLTPGLCVHTLWGRICQCVPSVKTKINNTVSNEISLSLVLLREHCLCWRSEHVLKQDNYSIILNPTCARMHARMHAQTHTHFNSQLHLSDVAWAENQNWGRHERIHCTSIKIHWKPQPHSPAKCCKSSMHFEIYFYISSLLTRLINKLWALKPENH